MSSQRSIQPDVRNPLLALPAANALANQPIETRLLLAGLLRDLRDDARVRADKAWRTHKAPMAVYWKAVGVYSNHLARLLSAQAAA